MRRGKLFFAALAAVGASPALAASTLTTLFTFNGGNGSSSEAPLIFDNAGNLYGETTWGGAHKLGTVFEINAQTHVLSTLVSFGGYNGSSPGAGLFLDNAGNLYGTATTGGSTGDGTVFEITATTHTLKTLVNFTGSDNGSDPECNLVSDANGNLYGTTSDGGTLTGDQYWGAGTVFELSGSTHALTTLFTFNGSDGGAAGAGLIVGPGGNLYGTTGSGGANGVGTLYELTASTHTLSTLITFNNVTGSPSGPLICDAAGNLYGTTGNGGADQDGTIFEIVAATGGYTTLGSFNWSNGANSYAGLIIDNDGNLFGTTYSGGNDGAGVLFELPAGSNSIRPVYLFDGDVDYANGAQPWASLVADAAGNLYGTTSDGGSGSGAGGNGTVFEISGTGFVSGVPEPGSLGLMGMGGLGLLGRRRRR